MNTYEEKLKTYLKEHFIDAEYLTFTESCHSVAEAATAVRGKAEDFVKNIVLLDFENNLIIAILKGEDRADLKKIEALLSKKIRIATGEEVLVKTGYPPGGVPSLGYDALFLIDEKVMEKEFVYSGGGSDHSLLKISPIEIQRINQGRIIQIRKVNV
ncbi:MAG: YbaK/EbsC family protein [Candidatus Nanoarchaeia archaeon]